MEFRHLRYIIAVAEEGHITRAAERLGIAQPPLSRLIKAIEQDIKVQLFRRVPRGVELTDAGRTFLDGARATFANLDRTLESARRTARGEEGQISVAFTSSIAFHPLVPRVIREFRESLSAGGRDVGRGQCCRADRTHRKRSTRRRFHPDEHRQTGGTRLPSIVGGAVGRGVAQGPCTRPRPSPSCPSVEETFRRDIRC